MYHRCYSITTNEISVEPAETMHGAWVMLEGDSFGHAISEYMLMAFLTDDQILELYNKLRATWTEKKKEE